MQRAHRRSSETLPILPLRDMVQFPGIISSVHIARERSLGALRAALSSRDKRILVLSQREMSEPEPRPDQLHEVGVDCEVLQATPFPDGTMRAILRGIQRVRLTAVFTDGCFYRATWEQLLEDASEVEAALVSECKQCFVELASVSAETPAEAVETIQHQPDPGRLADTIAHHLDLGLDFKQSVLTELVVENRLKLLYEAMRKEWHLAERRRELRNLTDAAIAESQRRFVMRQQLQTLQAQLLEEGDLPWAGLLERLGSSSMPEAPSRYVRSQIERLQLMAWDSPEASVAIKHIECLLDIPWRAPSAYQIDLKQAECVLDEAHLGHHEVKERILEFLAVRKLTGGKGGGVLCLEGPPGVGKTTLASAIARALGRPLISISLGGVRDEAELRGHRRTYVGAAPGRIIQGLIGCGALNPVCVIDEVDKLGAEGCRSDVAAALLEVLDPNLNQHFTDHFVSFPVDLSHILFVATANSAEGLMPALKDRLDVIPIGSYSLGERFEIARSRLVTRALKAHGLLEGQCPVCDETLQALASEADEPGVRELERSIADLCRKAARIVTATEGNGVALCPSDRRSPVRQPRRKEVGLAHALVVSERGGNAVQIEASILKPLGELPEIRMTGNMGNVMRESAETAVSFLRAFLDQEELRGGWRDVHIHASHGDKSKEGPSAGLAIVLAVYSAITGRPIDSDTAFTGEISLHGAVLQVGKIREKLVAAHRLGFTRVVLPTANLASLPELPKDVFNELRLVGVESVGDALIVATGDSFVDVR